MKNLFIVPDKLSKNLLSKDVINDYKKPIIIVSSVVGTLIIGGTLIRRFYLYKVKNELVNETEKREDEKKIKQQTDLNKSINLVQKDQSNSLPNTPSTENSPGLSILVQDKKSNSLAYDRISLNSHFIGRTGRKRNLNSICSYQLNLQIDNPIELIIFGNEYVKRAVKILEDVKLKNQDFDTIQSIDEFDEIINNAKSLIEQIQNFTKNSQQLDSQQNVIEQDDTSSRFESPEGSVASSALYSLAFYDTEPNLHFFKLYTHSIENLDKIIKPRVNRSEMVNCESLEEFYAKVNCIRNGFTHIFSKEENCNYFKQIGEYILKVLVTDDKEQQDCLIIYNDLIDFVSNSNNYEIIEQELDSRNIPTLSFYDLVLDYIILDSFDDLDNPPSSIINVMNQRWFGDQFKKKAIQAAINIVLKHKRNKLKIQDGFFNRLYNLLAIITPILAWGFFNTGDTDQKLKCNFIKQTILELVRDFFDFNRIRYTSLHDLTIDMLTVTDIRYEDLQNKLSIIIFPVV